GGPGVPGADPPQRIDVGTAARRPPRARALAQPQRERPRVGQFARAPPAHVVPRHLARLVARLGERRRRQLEPRLARPPLAMRPHAVAPAELVERQAPPPPTR